MIGLKQLSVAASVLVVAQSVAGDARAQHPDKDIHVPHPVRSDYGLHAYWWSAEGAGSTFPFLLYGRSEITDDVFVDFELPWTFSADTGGAADPIGALGNPALFVRYGSKGDFFSWTVGGGAAAPMGLIDDQPYRLALTAGSAAMGLYHAYLWSVDSLPIVARSGFEFRLARPLFLRLEVDPYGLVPLRSGVDFALASQQRVEFEAGVPRSVGGGVALHWVGAYLPDSIPDRFQSASEVFFSYDDEQDFFFRLGVLLALDEPLGLGFDQGKVLSGRVLVGSYFEED